MAASGPEGREESRGAEAAVKFDDVVAIPGDRERWLAVPFSQFIDRVMDIPVVRAALVQLCRRPWRFLRCPCSSTTSSSSPGSELKVPQIQFILFMPDIPVVPQRRAHSANCAEGRRDPTGACAVLGGV